MSKNVDNRIAEGEKELLTPAQERLLGFIVSRCAREEAVRLSKSEIAQHMGVCVRTVDRAVRRLRDEGYIEVKPVFSEDGGQTVNEYRLPASVFDAASGEGK